MRYNSRYKYLSMSSSKSVITTIIIIIIFIDPRLYSIVFESSLFPPLIFLHVA